MYYRSIYVSHCLSYMYQFYMFWQWPFTWEDESTVVACVTDSIMHMMSFSVFLPFVFLVNLEMHWLQELLTLSYIFHVSYQSVTTPDFRRAWLLNFDTCLLKYLDKITLASTIAGFTSASIQKLDSSAKDLQAGWLWVLNFPILSTYYE